MIHSLAVRKRNPSAPRMRKSRVRFKDKLELNASDVRSLFPKDHLKILNGDKTGIFLTMTMAVILSPLIFPQMMERVLGNYLLVTSMIQNKKRIYIRKRYAKNLKKMHTCQL